MTLSIEDLGCWVGTAEQVSVVVESCVALARVQTHPRVGAVGAKHSPTARPSCLSLSLPPHRLSLVQ